jgi:DNA invertase Pin-like site-specific DNA recombinase
MKREQMPGDDIPATGPGAVGYVRVAAISQAGPRSGLDAQIAQIRRVAEAERIEVIRVFEDAGESAHNARRRGLMELLAAVDSSLANVVIVSDLTRLTRDRGDLHRLMNYFDGRGVRLVSATERRIGAV